ncbi:unnamed protein product, partial [Didymodactylos carnosus]
MTDSPQILNDPIDDDKTSFDSLCHWILNELNNGHVLAIQAVKDHYLNIKQNKRETVTEYMMRTTTLKHQIASKLDNIIFFNESSQAGTYIVLNDVKFYALIVLNSSLSTATTCKQKPQKDTALISNAKILFSSIRLLLDTYSKAFETFDQINKKPEQLQHFSPDMYWSHVPMLLRNTSKGRNGISEQFSAQGIDKFCQT